MVKNWLIAKDTFSRVALSEESRQNEPNDFLHRVRVAEEKFRRITFGLGVISYALVTRIGKNDNILENHRNPRRRLLSKQLSYPLLFDTYLIVPLYLSNCNFSFRMEMIFHCSKDIQVWIYL
jgi:hypothetical protein